MNIVVDDCHLLGSFFFGKPMEIYGKPMEHLWENDGFGTQNPLAAIGIPCVFHVFPQVSHMLPVN